MGEPDPPGPPPGGLCREIETTLQLLLLLSGVQGVYKGWETWQDDDLGVRTSVGGQRGACHMKLLILRLGRGHGL